MLFFAQPNQFYRISGSSKQKQKQHNVDYVA